MHANALQFNIVFSNKMLKKSAKVRVQSIQHKNNIYLNNWIKRISNHHDHSQQTKMMNINVEIKLWHDIYAKMLKIHPFQFDYTSCSNLIRKQVTHGQRWLKVYSNRYKSSSIVHLFFFFFILNCPHFLNYSINYTMHTHV